MTKVPSNLDEFPLSREDWNELKTLLDQYQERLLLAVNLSSVHHLACSGGTLICRALASQPNVLMLSELDPLSLHSAGSVKFAPTDLILQAQASFRRPSYKTIEKMFLASLSALLEGERPRGMSIVLRDHAHSHFCTKAAYKSRATLRTILTRRFALRSIVTVRHPLDSYISLLRNDWIHFSPETLDEYAQRYTAFLDAYDDVKIYKYETFVAFPDETVREMAADLNLTYDHGWRETLPAVKLSGDSGRSGNDISSRPRRQVPEIVATQVQESEAYQNLCLRLVYEPNPN